MGRFIASVFIVITEYKLLLQKEKLKSIARISLSAGKAKIVVNVNENHEAC